MLRCYKYTIFIFLFTASSLGLKSQYIYDTLQLNEFEVISSIDDFKSTIKKTTIDSIARKELNLVDIGELLSAFTPVYVKSYGKGSLSTASFRGTGASHTKVLWEGFDINSPMLGQTDFSLLPGVFFDNIELLYGGSSLSESSGALGGSISLKSNGYNAKKKTIKFQQSVGSFSTYQTSLDINLNSSKFYSDTRVFMQSSLNDFSYFNNAILPDGKELKQSNAEFKNIGFTQQFSYKISNNQSISIISWNQWNERNIPPIMTNIEKGGNQKEWQNDFFSKNIFKWNYYNKNTNWEVKGAYFYENIHYYLNNYDSIGNTISLINSKNKIENYSLAGNFSSELVGGFIIQAGIKTDYQKVVSNNYEDKKHRNLLTGHISIKKTFANKLTTEALIRAEISNETSSPFMPMIGINYKPLENQKLYIRLVLSRNQNIPSLNDLYWYPGGNLDLIPEISLSSDLGIDYIYEIDEKYKITTTTSIYASSVENWIIWLPGDYRYWSPENIANVYARGIELSIKLNGNFRKLEYNIMAEYAYTRSTNNSTDAKQDGTSDIQLIYVPIHTANSYLNLNLLGYYTTWSLSYTGSRNTSLNNAEDYSYTLPSYLMNNVSVGKSVSIKKVNLDVRFKVNNLFDINYQAILWRAMPGRNYELSLSIKL